MSLGDEVRRPQGEVSAAVLVIDMQNGFIHPDGSLVAAGVSRVAELDRVIAETASLLRKARTLDLPIVYTRHQYRPGYVDAPEFARNLFKGRSDHVVAGSWDADIHDDVAPTRNDVIVEKNRYDAFLYTDLEVVLRALGARSVLIVGVFTNGCVESTARSADQRDLRVLVASDCTGAEAEFHVPALAVMRRLGMTVAPWSQALVELLSQDGPMPSKSRVANIVEH